MTKKEIIKRTRKWAEILCCNEIDLRIVFNKFSKDEMVKDKDDGDFICPVYTDGNSRYMEWTIHYNTERVDMIRDEEIVHELLHIKLGELSGYLYANEEKQKADQWKGYFEERFVSQMAKILTRKFYL